MHEILVVMNCFFPFSLSRFAKIRQVIVVIFFSIHGTRNLNSNNRAEKVKYCLAQTNLIVIQSCVENALTSHNLRYQNIHKEETFKIH